MRAQVYIRTQDRRELICLNQDWLKFTCVDMNGRHFIRVDVTERYGLILGEYESEERCIYVLTEIEDRIFAAGERAACFYQMPDM